MNQRCKKKISVDFIHEKGTGVLNEDAVIVNGRQFGVFDGATSLDSTTYEDGKTGGFLASHIAGEVLQKDNAPLIQLSREANDRIRSEMVSRGVDVSRKDQLWSTSAAAVRIDGDKMEWIQTGDSLILLIYEDNSSSLLVENFDHDRETLLMWREIASQSDDGILSALKKQIRDVRCGMNVNYGVMNGEKAAMDFINTGSEGLEGVKHILLFTDGLFIPRKNPGRNASFDLFVRIFLDEGLSGVRDHVRAIEKTDPDCRIYPRFKPHDDIAAVAVSL